MKLHNKIYALLDYQTLQKFDISLDKFLAICNSYNTVYIQYRDKLNSLDIQKKNLLFLKSNTNIPIIINDKLELLEFCDGIHLGQEDLEALSLSLKLPQAKVISFIRKKYKNKRIGISTHNEMEILETNNLPLDYIGLGAYRDTSTKDVPNTLGDNISYLAKMSKHPVGAIGGVRISDNIPNITYNVIGSGLLKLNI
ncbi:MAG: thiamine phosphate synthase [Campylobacterota bacterium]|nr:thiamine phosphate synthase [Campylobacterota bacterium]